VSQLSNKTLTRRIDASGATFINPFERWPDHNYAPYELDYVYNQNTESSEIIAPLHGYRPQDVHIAITRGQIIILMADDEDIAHFERQEFYCEVPLLPDARKNTAVVEFDSHFMTIRLLRKRALNQRMRSVATRCRNSFAFLLGIRWNLCRLDK
jgi:hypothetical protein